MKYRFDEIAINSTAKKLPTETDKDTYVGLEHLDPGTFVVSRWGAEAAPIGEKLLMKKGDVLFGKRRAYQKKVAIAPFDGIFSAHGMVLRPKESVVCPSFFPHFIASDYFLKEAIRISVGGLSPTINWKDLKALEFNLPPIEEQRRLADLLWAANDLKEAYKRAIVASDEMLKAKFREMFGNRAVIANVWSESTLNNVFQKPITGEWGEEDIDGTGIKVLRTTNFTDEGLIDYSDTVTRKIEPDKIVNKCLKDGDIIIEKSGGSDTKAVGRVVLFHDNGQQILFNNFTSVLRANNNKYNPLYLFMFLFVLYWDGGTKLYENQTTGIHNLKLQKFLESTTIPIPPQQVQEAFARLYKKHETGKLKLKTAIANLETTIKGIINQTLEG